MSGSKKITDLNVTERGYTNGYYTNPIMLDLFKIAYYPKNTEISNYITLFKLFIKPIISLILLGCILGYILYLVEPKRTKTKAIFGSLASLLGEMGRISDGTSLKIKGMIISFIIMVVSFYSVIFLQAMTIDKYFKLNENQFSPENLNYPKILIDNEQFSKYKYFKKKL